MPNAKVLSEKQAIVAALAERLKGASAGVFVDYKGITVDEDTKLRTELRQNDVEYSVVKNTLTRFALKDVGLEAMSDLLNGTTSLATSTADPIVPIRMIHDMSEKMAKDEKFIVKGAFLEGKVLSDAEIAEIAQLQNKDALYSKVLGSAAAPTAGLHFTPELMDTLRAKGVGIAEVTLHVGLGTFRPVMEDEITDHKMHSEWYSISEETAQRIRETKAAGHRVIAVGTTSCRTLEAVAAKYGEIKACSGNTSIFLYPGVQFHCIDGLITNFHLPESTLIMLVSALYGYEKTMAAYKVAVEQKYRFFSFGDAMLIV